MPSHVGVGAARNAIMEMAAIAICMDERIGLEHGVDCSTNTFDRRILNALG
jgi:hypothetical protein